MRAWLIIYNIIYYRNLNIYIYLCDSIGATYVVSLCQPVSQPAKCHTKRCLELQDIAAGHTTFVDVADMSAGPVLLIVCIPTCPVFCQYILTLFL